MKKLLSCFDKMMMALTFAEANEQDTAREIISSGWDDSLQKGLSPAKATKTSGQVHLTDLNK